jgi:hypothetical protein
MLKHFVEVFGHLDGHPVFFWSNRLVRFWIPFRWPRMFPSLSHARVPSLIGLRSCCSDRMGRLVLEFALHSVVCAAGLRRRYRHLTCTLSSSLEFGENPHEKISDHPAPGGKDASARRRRPRRMHRRTYCLPSNRKDPVARAYWRAGRKVEKIGVRNTASRVLRWVYTSLGSQSEQRPDGDSRRFSLRIIGTTHLVSITSHGGFSFNSKIMGAIADSDRSGGLPTSASEDGDPAR